MQKDEFEKKKDSLSEMLYIRYIYMEIDNGKIILNSSNYFKMKESKHGFKRFSQIIERDADKKEFDVVINDNIAFLNSIKKSLFGNVSFDKNLLKRVIDGVTKSYNKFYERLTQEQIKEVEESTQIHYNIGKVVGGGFLFVSE